MAAVLPFVSVIIPVYNDEAALRLCLDLLEKQTYPADSYEVIVVDNNSSSPLDNAVVPFPHVKLLQETRRGSYVARNTGLAAAKGDHLAFIDSDCLPALDWLEKGVSYLLRNPDCGLVAGRVETFAQNPNHPTAVELYELLYAFPIQYIVETQHLTPAGNLFTFRSVFDAVGPFDATLQSGGDSEWGLRVHAHNYRQIYADDVIVRHPARRTWAELHKKHARTAKGYALPASDAPRSRGIIPPLIQRQLRILRESNLPPFQKAQVLAIMLRVYALRASIKLRRRVSR